MSETAYRPVQALHGPRNHSKAAAESETRFRFQVDRFLDGAGCDLPFTDAERLELKSLASESDSALLGGELLALAGRWQAADKWQHAMALYQVLASDPSWAGEGFTGLRNSALQQIEVLQGQGPMGARAEVLLRRLVREATDPTMIAPMMLGSAISGLVRSTSLGRLLAAEGAGFWTRGWGARGAAEALGLAAEVPTFAFTGHALRGLRTTGESLPGLGRELGSAALSLGLLKITGVASQTFLSKAGFVPQAASGFFFSQGTQLLGLMAAHGAEVALGWRPATSSEGFVLDNLACLLSLGVGAHLGRSVLGSRWARFQAGLELSAQAAQAALPSGEAGSQASLALAASIARPSPSIRLDFKAEDLLQPMRMEEFKWRDFQRELEKVRSSLTAPDAKTRSSLAKLAEQTTQESPHYKRQPEWHAYLAMRDFAKLRALAGSLLARLPKTLEDQLSFTDKETWEDLLIAHLTVRDYPTVFKLLRHPVVAKFDRDEGDDTNFDGIVFASIPVRDSYVVDYADRRGFTKAYNFDLIPTLHDLVSLAQNYDVFVGIARGGLYSASVADLLGLNNFVMEVHAHGKRKASSRWVDPVHEGQFAGKRVLLLDKDAVTGATVQEAMRLLRPFNPAEVGIYFNHGPQDAKRVYLSDPVGEPGFSQRLTLLPSRRTPQVLPPAAARRIRAQGVKVHHSGNVAEVPMESVESQFYAAHDRLKTPLGRLRATKLEFQRTVLPSAEETAVPIAEELQRRWDLSLQFHDSLNPLVPGVRQVRESIVSFLETSVRDFQSVLGVTSPGESKHHIYSRLNEILGQPRNQEPMAEDFARARYVPWAYRLAQRRGIALEHFPSSYVAAFRTAQEALEQGDYDIALIVGPEAFAYEPIFQDLEIPTVAVNIPEADFGGKRSMKKLEPLDLLKGKRVLVVEDDVRSGATLERLLRGIKSYGPFPELGLFLGLPQAQQLRENIPRQFQKVFISDPQSEQNSAAFLEQFSRREKIFIDDFKP